MKIFWTVFIVIILIATSHDAHAQFPNLSIKVYGYLTTWALKMNIGASNYENLLYTDMDWDACTDYIMFAAHFDSSGQITAQITWDGTLSWGGIGEDQIQQSKRRFLNDYIHSKGKSNQLCFFIASNNPLMTTANGRAAVIKTVVDSVISSMCQYDGVHWDIEPFSLEDSINVKTFLVQMRDTLDKYHRWDDITKKPMQTVAFYGNDVGAFWASCAPYLDALLHMSYDMFGNWQSITWYNAPLYTTDYTGLKYNVQSIDDYITSWLSFGIPANKLVMGCPFNYNAYQGGTTSGGEGCSAPLLTMSVFPTWINNGNEMYYAAWNKWIDTATTTIHHDTTRVAAWIGYNNPGSANDYLILFQDTMCVRQIIERISVRGIQGAMIWEIPGAYINSLNQTRHPGLVPDHLLQAAKKTRLDLQKAMSSTGDIKLPPIKYSLYQNYPNPFNPSTTISFSIPSKSFVSLKVYDLLGREVAKIVSKELPAGNYSRQWDAFNVPSGIYFYRLSVGAYWEAKKLVLLK
jgi:Glycosyl hydrolases family 18/Secretion system C-terminal sorting domain